MKLYRRQMKYFKRKKIFFIDFTTKIRFPIFRI